MSEMRIACLLAPMVDTEGPMDVLDGKVLNGPKKIMGKYGEVGLETAITFAENHPDKLHIDLLSIGTSKELKTLQQNAIAMSQPAKLPAGFGVHALEIDDVHEKDAFAIADLLVGMVNKLEQKPDLILAGKDSNDYCHGIVGAYLAVKLGMPYYTGVSEVSLDESYKSITATFLEGGGKLIKNIQLPVTLGTTDTLNGKDSARFTSLKGVMMAKKFKRNILSASDLDVQPVERTAVLKAEEVVKDRKNQLVTEGEGADKVKEAMHILVDVDKALEKGTSSSDGQETQSSITWNEVESIDLSQDIVLLADHDGTQVRLSTYQALNPLKKLAAELGKKITVLLCVENTDSFSSSFSTLDVDRVLAIPSESFKHATGYAIGTTLKQVFGEKPPAFIFFIANDLGHDTATYLAGSYQAPYLPGLSSIHITDGKLNGTRVIANARYLSTETALQSDPMQLGSIRPTAFDPQPEGQASEIMKLTQAPDPILTAKIVEFLAGVAASGIPLPEAKVIIAGGRGMKSQENFKQLEELAAILGGAVGGSRAVTDLNWLPHNLQIGQTGETVAPDLYIAIGISGAIQHLTGMNDSKYIVAINSDEEAPIHQHADLSIVDKWENVLPAFIEAVKATIG